jgi:bla regulator protein blaR1
MSDGHIEAIIAHELAHARRFDNASAALHTLVEAAFWFYPLVWWMERRMIEERELACDEIVIGLGGSPDAYAEALLKTCRFCVGSPLPCTSGVTGADLKKRVVGIMTARGLMRMTWPKRMLVGAAALCVAAVPVILGQLNVSTDWEKTAGGKMAFEVASVKENKSGVSASNMPASNVPLDAQNLYGPTGGLFSAANFPLLEYMRFAYKMTPEQDPALMSQVPWANTNRWDIEGRASGNPTKDQMRLMLQALLADRFKLKLHFETRQLPVFALVLNKPGEFGPQLRAHVDEPPCSAAAAGSSYPQRGIQVTVAGGFPESCGELLPLHPSAAGELRIGARDVPMAILAMLFSSPLTGVDRPVVDSTELKGNFDLIIEFMPQRNGRPASRRRRYGNDISGGCKRSTRS